MKHAFIFHDNENGKDERYLNLVMDYIPDTVYKALKQYNKLKKAVPFILVKHYAF